jgi:type II secretory pathway pseudopilin PulG
MTTRTGSSANELIIPTTHRRPGATGFVLIELAIALVILTLLLGGLLVPIGAQVEQRQYAETEKQLSQIRESLIGYAISNGHLPCPAVSTTNGAEDRTGSACTSSKRVGFLPWVTLGVNSSDAWGNLFRYSVTPAFADSGANTKFTLDEPTDITIQAGNNTAAVNLSVPNGIPAAVLSHGKNGYGATSETGKVRALPGTWDDTLDEKLNATNDDEFWSRTRTTNTGIAGGQFDDALVWISPSILYSRMVAAGRLP